MPDLSVAENLYLGALPRGRLGTVAGRRIARDLFWSQWNG
jgi:hypothetical protein